MNVGSRVTLSDEGRFALVEHYFKGRSDISATVVRPGRFRGGLKIRVLVDGDKSPRTFAAKFWQEEESA
jgi:hypothetical protein